MSGKLDYLGFWHNNSMVAAGTEILSILPPQNQVVGEAHISSSGAGKVKIGQEVNVKLRDFPYDEYGLIKGRVISMSKLTNKNSDGESCSRVLFGADQFSRRTSD